MRLELYRRGTIIRNQMIFIILSFIFLQIVHETAVGRSAIDKKTLFLLLEKHRMLFVLGVVTLILTYYGKKLAKYFFVFYASGIIVLSLQAFVGSFDKIILILNFIYILLSYYFYFLFASELNQSLYSPGFANNSIGAKCEYDLPVSLERPKIEDFGKLSNWDRESCFVAVNDGNKLPRGNINLSIIFEGQKFSFQGIVGSRVGQGIGIRIKSDNERKMFDWLDFYEIIQSRGYRLRFARGEM